MITWRRWDRLRAGPAAREASRRASLTPPVSLAVQITFPSPVILSAVKVGAVPASGLQASQAELNLFARDLECLASARFARVCGTFTQPESGTRTVRFEVRAAASELAAGRPRVRPAPAGECGVRPAGLG
jgi:hypothetical protein